MSANAIISSDLHKSGITIQDISLAQLGIPERSALDIPANIPGYIIPYFDINGFPIPFYRARLFDFAQKYRQPRGTGNHVYFPRLFRQTLNGHPYVILTEGEKKAVSATARGYPTVSLGGVYSWRNKTITLPSDAVVSQGGKTKGPGAPLDIATTTPNKLQIKLPSEFDPDKLISEYATGFEPLVNLVKLRNLTVVIAFDSNQLGLLDDDIQKAAGRLAMELRFLGVPFRNIRQLLLPNPRPEEMSKIGLDDYFTNASQMEFERLLNAALGPRGKFPNYPNMHQFVSKKLSNPKLSRKEVGLIGLSIIADLDSQGKRLKSDTGLMYYFEGTSKRLMKATAPMSKGPVLLDDEFNTHLYRQYSITANDPKVQRQVSAQYVGEQPVDLVTPRRSLFIGKETLYYQISDSQFITCDASHPCRIHDNGSEGTLFEGTSKPLDTASLLRHVANNLKEFADTGKLTPWWFHTLKATRLKGLSTSDKPARLLSLLFYTSPWLFRWRGTQLPVELATGEAGSGKSTLYSLRQTILQGAPDLKNTPNTIRDWQASIASTGGLHVIDNMSLTTDRNLKQQLSDEMCRIATEPTPTVEMRKFYTEHELVKVPISTVFAITAIQLPFHQSDLIQRAVHIELDKGIEGITYDSDWASAQLEDRGGREAWVAHHLTVLHLFFQKVSKQKGWQEGYRAKYRLINFEQILLTMADIFGWERNWIPDYLTQRVGSTVADADWVMEGLKEFVTVVVTACQNAGVDPLQKRWSANDISSWASSDDEYKDCIPLCNPRKLGRYLTQHKGIVSQITGLKEAGSRANRMTFSLGTIPNWATEKN